MFTQEFILKKKPLYLIENKWLFRNKLHIYYYHPFLTYDRNASVSQ